jgi:lipopolysaccharide/colanic/teichoic acid biosynthesis glycosyltransferase
MSIENQPPLLLNRDSPSTSALTLDDVFMTSIPAAQREQSAWQDLGLLLQRTAEVLIAAAALIVTSPIMLVVALIIRFDSPGPVIFRQRRVGMNGRVFMFYKFRTLYADAKERFPELYAYAYTPSEVVNLKFKREEDPRITRAGRWLRKSTLDELPNFWNLLKGDIAIVGPRPEIPEMLKHYTPDQLLKFAVRPGITGLAQTHGRGNLAFQKTIAWDIEYVKNKSLWLDLKIIVRTVRMLTTLDGAF